MAGLFIYFFLFAFITSAGASCFFIHAAPGWGFLDYPSERKIHQDPTPLLGGAAVFIAVYLTIILHLTLYKTAAPCKLMFDTTFLFATDIKSACMKPGFIKVASFLLGGILIFITGLMDDRKGLRPGLRIAAETSVACMVVTFGIRPGINELSHVLGFIIAVGWIVGITNGFNLIDGINGLCAGNSLISSSILLIIAVKGGNNFTGLILIILIGALTGFFIFNFPKARIFSGSCGSMFVGYSLSVLVMFQSYGSNSWSTNPIPIIMPALILSVPLADTVLVIYRRIKNRMSIFSADTNHIHHRLRRLRMTDTEVLFIILLTSFAIGINATLLYKSTLTESMIILAQAFTVFLILEYILRIKERRINRRRSASGLLSVRIKCKHEKQYLFNGFIVDISTTGMNFCLLNLEKSFTEKKFFTGKKMSLEFKPARQIYHIEKPFQQILGTGILEEKIAENAVKIGLEFSGRLNTEIIPERSIRVSKNLKHGREEWKNSDCCNFSTEQKQEASQDIPNM